MDYEKEILGKLMYHPQLRYSDLQLTKLTSKHFNYYLKKLVDEGLIEKYEKFYYLTNKGKDLVGKMDEKSLDIEQQPKISVAIMVEREGGKEKEYLLTRRLKQPYYGKVGGFTGKVRFGETFEETARRELLEESGLTGEFSMKHIKRKLAHDRNEIVQDQIMFFFLVKNPKGRLIEKNNEQENYWVPFSEILKIKDTFNTFHYFFKFTLENEPMEDIEIRVEAEGY